MSEEYTDENRYNDFDLVCKYYNELVVEFGKKIVAIRCGEILGVYSSYDDAINSLKDRYEFGQYSMYDLVNNPNIPVHIPSILHVEF